MSGKLVVCPTPIGNLGDITKRVAEALAEADVVASEDTRRTRILLDHLGINTRPIALHDRNERGAIAGLVEKISQGEKVALVSDAGTPVVSDPGFLLIRACVESGANVEVLPGPTAVTTALVASGLPADSFTFVGFLPRKAGELERLFSGSAATLVAFESPNRIAAAMKVLAEFEPDRKVAVCRELTKVHEEVIRGSAEEVAQELAKRQVKGEVTVVVGPPEAEEDVGATPEAIGAARDLVAAGAKPRAAAKVVAKLTGARANDLYAALGD